MTKNLLATKKVRETPFRLAVLEVFNNHKNAISLSTIENELGKHDRITLYRTLKTFSEKGIVHEITMPEGEKRMALCADDCAHTGSEHKHQHIHLECKVCNEVLCVELEQFPTIGLKDHTIDSLEILAKGTCPSCN